MISLKKHIESSREAALETALDCYRAALAAMGESGVRACPSAAGALANDLLALRDRVSGSAPDSLAAAEKELELKLEEWASRAAGYHLAKAGEVREIMVIMAQAAQAVADRDQRYRNQFGSLTERLQTIGHLDDLGRVRQELNRSVAEIRTSVERMVEDGRESITRLKQELNSYEAKLQAAERASSEDSLTGLRNRLGFERALAGRLAQDQEFSLIVLDLNGFKPINDEFGHQAGDELLKSFSEELRTQFRPGDVLARWGGDEFAILLDAGLGEAAERLERVRKWVFGDYTVKTPAGPRKVKISAAAGVAGGKRGMSAEALFAAADAAMYRDKAAARQGAR